MTKLSLTFACESYDRIRALQDGRVRPEGIDLNVVALPVEESSPCRWRRRSTGRRGTASSTSAR